MKAATYRAGRADIDTFSTLIIPVRHPQIRFTFVNGLVLMGLFLTVAVLMRFLLAN
jgi:hypothetical protein